MKPVKGPKLTNDELRSAKIKITTFLDEDVLMELKKLADKSGGKYQTLMNQILRNYLLDKGQGLFERIERLEKAVFNKKAA